MTGFFRGTKQGMVPKVKRNMNEVQQDSAVTLAYYDDHAEEFWRGTKDHDVSQNIEALLRYIEAPPPFTILDLGCGPGRDLKDFTRRGHIAIRSEEHTSELQSRVDI